MNDIAGLVAGILGGAVGLLGLLMWEVLLLASAPNSTPQQEAQIKLWMLVALVGGLGCLAGTVVLIVVGRPWWGAAVGVLPMAALFVFIVALSVK